jgi:hypothetical protein
MNLSSFAPAFSPQVRRAFPHHRIVACHRLAWQGEGLNQTSPNSLKVHLFSLSLTSTAFAWFSSLAPSSIDSWDQSGQKFHDHFFSGSYQLKLTDLTSVRQSKEESVSDYLKRFKEVKRHYFNLSLTDSDLADLAAAGLRSAPKIVSLVFI